jgi:hypothetical protein
MMSRTQISLDPELHHRARQRAARLGISFAAMLRLGLRRVAAFDGDFAVFRFGRGRKQAFEVLR